jgi:hypothetical protein
MEKQILEFYNKWDGKFHCFYCGAELKEVGLGWMECEKCEVPFLPSLDIEGENQCMTAFIQSK